ncbi:MAG: alanine racemase [Clostridia bacterium]|nr:alanine racemase [Clostridia bacterium]
MNFLRRTWAEISESAILCNLNEIKKHAGNAKIMAVVKADAYGHSAEIVAPILQKQGVDGFAVSNIEEALSLRICGIKKPILILGYTPENYVETLAQNDISQCVYSLKYARILSDYALAADVNLNIHLKLDTGMSRLGFDCRKDTRGIKDAIKAANLPCFNIEGIFTHFAAADSDKATDVEFTKSQYEHLLAGVKELKTAGINPQFIHCDNSAAVCRDKYTCDFVRPGIALYGLTPDRMFDPKLKLSPVMTVKSVVSFVKRIKTGERISYGLTYTAQKNMRIATVAAGYADGYPRALSNKGEVIVRGKRAKIVGRICMDQFMIDVTDIDGVSMGDEVTLFGNGLSVDGIAEACGTINYEIVCGIAPRVPRVIIK